MGQDWTRRLSYSDYKYYRSKSSYLLSTENIKINLRFRSGTNGLNEELVLGTVVEATIL